MCLRKALRQQTGDVISTKCSQWTIERRKAPAVPTSEAKQIPIGHLLAGACSANFRQHRWR
jgi:hypothetical protein